MSSLKCSLKVVKHPRYRLKISLINYILPCNYLSFPIEDNVCIVIQSFVTWTSIVETNYFFVDVYHDVNTILPGRAGDYCKCLKFPEARFINCNFFHLISTGFIDAYLDYGYRRVNARNKIARR